MKEQFKNMKLKDVFANEACEAAIKELAPQLTKFPLAMVANKKAGEIFTLAVSMKLVDEATRDKIVEKLESALGIE